MNNTITPRLERWTKRLFIAALVSGFVFMTVAFSLPITMRKQTLGGGGLGEVALLGMWVVLSLVLIAEYRKTQRPGMAESTKKASYRLMNVLSIVLLYGFSLMLIRMYIW